MTQLWAVSSPEPSFSGEVAKVVFSRGQATVDGANVAALGYFRRRGYTVELLGAFTPEPETTDEVAEVAEHTSDDADKPSDVATDGAASQPEQDHTGAIRRPRVGASKDEWVDYAVALGQGRDMAKDSTKDDLIKTTKEQEASR